MRKLTLILGIIFLSACSEKRLTERELKAGIWDGFYEKYGYEATDIQLIKTDENNYTGYIVLQDGSTADINVMLDIDKPTHYMWEVTKPSPSMIADRLREGLQKYQDNLKHVTDSVLQTLNQ